MAILKLQKSNLKTSVSKEEIKSDGFVTVVHNLELLKIMSKLEPQFIAKHKGDVVGYALSMHSSLSENVPVLQPMFYKMNDLKYNGQVLQAKHYLTMGQVCVAKAYRGKNVFSNLYENMFNVMRSKYQFIVTEVSLNNTRSIRAHQKVGFEELLNYKDETDHWSLIIKAL